MLHRRDRGEDKVFGTGGVPRIEEGGVSAPSRSHRSMPC